MMKRNMIERLSSVTDLPDEPIPGQTLLELYGTHRALIEHHDGVIEYGDSCIRVKVKFGDICVEGTELELKRMTRGQLIISGRIQCVQLNRG